MQNRRLPPVLATLLLSIGCAHIQQPMLAEGPPPRPAGFTCMLPVLSTSRSPDSVYASARKALAEMHVVPWRDDSERRLVVFGANAPAGHGTSQMMEGRLYLDFGVSPAPGDSAGSHYYLEPGLTNEPAGLRADDRRALYQQAEYFSIEFATRARLPSSGCYGGQHKTGES